MIGEITAKVIEVTAKVAEEAVKETAKETAKAVAEKGVDVTKRLDVTKKAIDSKSSGIDVTKRIKPENITSTVNEIKSKDLSEIAKDYISDLKIKSEVADTLKNKDLDVSKFEPRSPEQVKKMREDFDDNKAKLRKEWEQLNNREWPKYDHDVYNKDGVRIRKVGDCYDAHHIQPLSLGGKNEASNLTPLDLTKHSEVHSAGGSCTKLVEKFMGGKA